MSCKKIKGDWPTEGVDTAVWFKRVKLMTLVGATKRKGMGCRSFVVGVEEQEGGC